MSHHMYFQILKNLLRPKTIAEKHDKTMDNRQVYIDEHNRLEKIVTDSENLWEDRTYQIAAGGLSLSFAVFSFLCGRGDVHFDCHMAAIWVVYAGCLIANYVSHHIAVKDARKMQDYLASQRKHDLPYDEDKINKKYEKQGAKMQRINLFVEIFLVLDVIYTVIYTCVRLSTL